MNTSNITQVCSAFEMYASAWNPVAFSAFEVGNISMISPLLSTTQLSSYGAVSAANITLLTEIATINTSALNV